MKSIKNIPITKLKVQNFNTNHKLENFRSMFRHLGIYVQGYQTVLHIQCYKSKLSFRDDCSFRQWALLQTAQFQKLYKQLALKRSGKDYGDNTKSCRMSHSVYHAEEGFHRKVVFSILFLL